MHADSSDIEFGGNTPSGGKFAEPWNWHGWSADPKHKGDSGFKKKSQSYYDQTNNDDAAADEKSGLKSAPTTSPAAAVKLDCGDQLRAEQLWPAAVMC